MDTTGTQMMELLDNYIQSRSFVSDEYVRTLIEKSINLGITWDVVKETLKKFLSAYFQKKNYTNIDLYRMDFGEVFDETRFFDQLVMTSIQMEGSTMRNHDDEADEEGDEAASSKSPRQQSFQEYVSESMHRLNDKSNLRPIIVDGSDVALSAQHNKQMFALGRVQKVIEYFEKRNHRIYVIIPQWRKEQIVSGGAHHAADQCLLADMEKRGLVHYSPSKRVGGKRMYCDDDSFILNLAVIKQAIIVSNDNFKRFLNQRDEFKQVIEERVLMYSFIEDNFMPAEDPLGKNGPSLSNFLRFESFQNQQYMKRCPYKKKCTYGSKCKFWHPERGAATQSGQQFKTAFQSVLDQSSEQRLKLEIILNEPQESTIATQLMSFKSGVSFQSGVERDSRLNPLFRIMGPAANAQLDKRQGYSLFPDKNEVTNKTQTPATTTLLDQTDEKKIQLKNKLKDILGDEAKVNQFLCKYKNETEDEEKLLFLANGYSFDF